MASPIQLLQLSPTMSEGTIVRWLVKEGDKVSAGTTLAEVETDKAVMELESFEDGKILKLTVKEGDSVPVGSTIGYIGQAGEAIPGDGAAPAPNKADAKPAAKAEEKAPAAVAPAAKVEKVVAVAAAAGSNGSAGKAAVGDRVFASPLARKMAAEHGISLDQLHGSGPGNRVIKRDIEAALESGVTAEVAQAPAPQKPAAVAVPAGAGDEEVSLSGMRKVIARRLVQSRQEVPSFSLTVEVAAEPVERAVARVCGSSSPRRKSPSPTSSSRPWPHGLMKHEWLRTQWVDGKLMRKNGGSYLRRGGDRRWTC
jgi:pyruvate dehydrogenase E2 component (dihydrolipoamide acetyltransferase)